MTSIPDLSQLDPDQQIKRNLIARPDLRPGVLLPPVVPPPPSTQGVQGSQMPDPAPPVVAQPNISPAQSRVDYLRSQPSGISGLHPKSTIGKIGKGALQGLDILGSTFAPGIAANIPGTTMHHNVLEAQAERQLGSDVANQAKQAETTRNVAEAKKADADANLPTAEASPEQQAFDSLIKQGVAPSDAFKQVMEAKNKPTAPNEFATWLQQNPGKTVADFEKMKAEARPKAGNDFEQYYQQYLHDNNLPDSARNRLMARQQYEAAGRKPDGDEGSWQMVEDANGKPVMFNSKTGATRAAPAGIAPKGTHAKAEQEYNKNQAPVQAALDFADSYLNSGAYTGSGDDTLMLQYFELAKPSTGFRLNQSEIQRQQKARSWREGVEARIRHATTGVWFSDEQRKQIVDSMHAIGKAKQEAMHGGGAEEGKDFGPAPAGKAEGSTGTAPDGTKVVVRNGRIVAQ